MLYHLPHILISNYFEEFSPSYIDYYYFSIFTYLAMIFFLQFTQRYVPGNKKLLIRWWYIDLFFLHSRFQLWHIDFFFSRLYLQLWSYVYSLATLRLSGVSVIRVDVLHGPQWQRKINLPVLTLNLSVFYYFNFLSVKMESWVLNWNWKVHYQMSCNYSRWLNSVFFSASKAFASRNIT